VAGICQASRHPAHGVGGSQLASASIASRAQSADINHRIAVSNKCWRGGVAAGEEMAAEEKRLREMKIISACITVAASDLRPSQPSVSRKPRAAENLLSYSQYKHPLQCMHSLSSVSP